MEIDNEMKEKVVPSGKSVSKEKRKRVAGRKKDKMVGEGNKKKGK